MTGRVLERYYYSPYGELEVVRDAHFFDYDDDGDVDDDDETAFTACIGETSGDCLRFDADCDGEVTEVDDGESSLLHCHSDGGYGIAEGTGHNSEYYGQVPLAIRGWRSMWRLVRIRTGIGSTLRR